MTPPRALPGPAGPPRGLASRLRVLLQGWRARALVASLLIVGLKNAGLPLPWPLTAPAKVLICLFAVWGIWRLGRALLRRMLWKIRTKLILSYLFIAVVPVILLGILFVLAGVFSAGLVASYLMSAEVDRKGRALEVIAEATLDGLDLSEPDLPGVLEKGLAAAARIHSNVSHALVRGGEVLASAGDAPHVLPEWWKGPSLAGLVQDGGSEVLRTVVARGDTFLALDAPLDAELFG